MRFCYLENHDSITICLTRRFIHYFALKLFLPENVTKITETLCDFTSDECSIGRMRSRFINVYLKWYLYLCYTRIQQIDRDIHTTLVHERHFHMCVCV